MPGAQRQAPKLRMNNRARFSTLILDPVVAALGLGD